ncbi:unnamed protein product, partial [Ectocarpus sp. 12 AP-2014]
PFPRKQPSRFSTSGPPQGRDREKNQEQDGEVGVVAAAQDKGVAAAGNWDRTVAVQPEIHVGPGRARDGRSRSDGPVSIRG